MRLVKRLIEVALVILVISLFMKNKDIVMEINYFGLSEPIRIAFWELVTFCVSLGIIIAAFGDFITQLKWVGERRRMIKADKEHKGEVSRLTETIAKLEKENGQFKRDLEQRTREVSELKSKEFRTTAVTPLVGPQSVEASPSPEPEKSKKPAEKA